MSGQLYKKENLTNSAAQNKKNENKIMLSTSKYYMRINGKDVYSSEFLNYKTEIDNIEKYLLECKNYKIVLTETLIDKLFKILEKDLLVKDTNLDEIEYKIIEFCKQHKIWLQVEVCNKVDQIQGMYNLPQNYILVKYPPGTDEKLIMLVVLHELSHYITHKSASGKLSQFMKDPPSSLNLLNLQDIKQELDYLLTPNELANWAVSVALELFQEAKINLNDLIFNIKNDIKTHNSIMVMDISKYYKSLGYFTKSLYKIYFLMFTLEKNPSVDTYISVGYNSKFNKLIKLIDKYIKRLGKLFGMPTILNKKLKLF